MTKMKQALLLGSVALVSALAVPHSAQAAMKVLGAPELDPGSAVAALTLLSGAITIVRARRGGKK